MSRKWRPGDVAMLSSVNGEAMVGFAVGAGDEVSGWRTEDGTFWGPRYTNLARRLIVTDCEDPRHVQTLLDVFESAIDAVRYDGHGPSVLNLATDGLRALTTSPSKPEEPTGLGAVVETANGKRYVRWAEGFFDGRAWAPEDGASNALTWEHLDAIKVLSEGVTP